ncbi:MAG TPA: PqqD family peptide modification chaperone [Candidatus Acidoferrales bacterium]|jgi:hypothetical protein
MATGISLNSLVVAAKENLSCALGDEAAILQMRSGVYYGLNPVGARLWTLLAEPRTVEDLRETLITEYEVEPARCEEDLLALLENMHAKGLIEIRSE